MGVNDGLMAVGTTSVQLLPARFGKRLDYSIVATAAANYSIQRGESLAVDKQGVYLVGIGGSWSESSDAGVRCFQGPIQIISDAAAGTVAFSERIME